MDKFTIVKEFDIPIGHRLSKHLGRCRNFHGHNIKVLVGVSSNELNDNDMVVDFSDLKNMVMSILDSWDHTLFVNENDPILEDKNIKKNFRILSFETDPTAESLSKFLYWSLIPLISNYKYSVRLEFITIYENDRSQVTYKFIS